MTNLFTDTCVKLTTAQQMLTELLNKKTGKHKLELGIKDINRLHEVISNIRSVLSENVPKLEQNVSASIKQELYLSGKYMQLTQMLKLCCDDYSYHGRYDAVHAIQGVLNK